ncbi:sugar ABC transporter permease [Peterkaempfera bronchialis]|uniref:Sugar ABC transporter permease n=1 Tax=Peterkaempfera bronchialis TaxID=2126346 RepID=A0A345SR68_9ACTN|nr:sugar ABC transporter permease [Peterkaempfera bronchialis]AXI76223.1 sugar ABC transporter permease [Peterkaempfera bronchialis]
MTGQGAAWAERALESVLERTRRTAAEVGSRFPLYAEPDTGRWTTTARGSWTGGFWAGLLWLRARATGDPADRAAACAATRSLEFWTDQDTATRGLIFWYGTAPADDCPAAAGLRTRAAQACLSAYDSRLGLVPWGGAFGGPRLLARADGVPGLVPLLAGAGADGRAAAHRMLVRQLGLCLAEDPPRPAWQSRPDGGWAAHPEPAPGWSRTAAWLLLAASDGLHRASGDRRLALGAPVDRLVALRLGEAARPVPRACGEDPAAPVDTSAAAIEAVAALKLAALADAAGRYEDAARLAGRGRQVLGELCAAHLSVPGDRGRPAGMLLDGCYDAERGLAVRHELIWGDFFLALGLAILTGLVGPFDC